MKLIDADAQIDTAREEMKRRLTEAANAGYMYSAMFNEGKIFYAIKSAAINAPAIDAVPVVRCKDCIYSEPNDGLLVEGARYCRNTYCGVFGKYSSVWDCDYCSYGKRKDVQK